MNKIFAYRLKTILILFVCAVIFLACNRREAPAPNAFDRDTSYAFGMLTASQMGFVGLSFDYEAFMEGFRDFNEARETRFTQDRAMDLIIAALTRMEAQDEEEMLHQAQRNLEEGETYMAQNAERPGVVTTASWFRQERYPRNAP